ncbi:cupin domain-containing protein [Ancylobacter amanitiformis]|uniref:Quercetin dioxygenase-like cupin family protein n=1 Tax=Ancylobacter amanitiformis TaxID=217069 RepID=A0ABU0LUZ7_9HYPH|nr:cupin domain-containing protein [Ancylobacter amanitiformis]MDQ0512484.1 quercetin dioxygenase-like cupin family protein [Ancylobacter amanitiformis]
MRTLIGVALASMMTSMPMGTTPAAAHGTEAANTVRLPGSKDATVTVVYQHPLPDLPGKSLKGVLVEYGPGGYSPSHTHARSAIIYATVLEGRVRSKVNDGPETEYEVGEHWTELPGDHHGVSANASTTAPAKILAVFVVDTDDNPLTIPDPQ